MRYDMKKWFSIFVAIIIGFVSCSETDETYLKVVNKSDYAVTFKLLHSDSDTLLTNETGYYSDYYAKEIYVEEFHSSPIDFRVTPIYLKSNEVEFHNAIPINIEIINTFSVKVTIRSDFMEPSEISVPANSVSSPGILIYTQNPTFIVVADNYPATIEYSYDEANNALYGVVK